MAPAEEPIRIMVVDDSAVIRWILGRLVDEQPDLHLETTASNGETALAALRNHPVDIILLDIEMPVMDGLMALPIILKEYPDVRIIMCSTLTHRGAEETIRGLSLGAADYIPKPSAMRGGKGLEAISAELLAKIRALAGRRRSSDAAALPIERRRLTRPVVPRVLAIGASTGGPNALVDVLSALPETFPLPILVVQHMPPIFTTMLAQRIEKATGKPAREAEDRQDIEPGRIYLAPGDHHMVVEGNGAKTLLRLNQDPPENFCRPAVDPLFRSAAQRYGADVMAVVLTGMGEDGCRGCREIAAQGGVVIAQDEATSVVWGMPGAVAQAGLASEVLPLCEIPPHIMNYCEAQVT